MTSKHTPLFEALEDRRMLDGVVDVVLSGNVLKITGDNLSNQVLIVQAGNELLIEGLDGTLINGPTAFDVGLLGAVRINMRGGDDLVQIVCADGTMWTRQVIANMGAGNDVLWLDGVHTEQINANLGPSGVEGNLFILESDIGPVPVVQRNLTVTGGAGPDEVFIIDATIGGNVNLNLGHGDNLALIALSTIGGNLQYRVGNGDDTFDVSAVTVGRNLLVNTGNGNDTVMINVDDGFEPLDTQVDVTGNASFNLGGGFANILVGDRIHTGGSLAVTSRASGDNIVVLTNFSTQRNLQVNLRGRGDALVVLDQFEVVRGAAINTGAGSDEIVMLNFLSAGHVSVNTGTGDFDQVLIDADDVNVLAGSSALNVSMNANANLLELGNTQAFTGRFVGRRNVSVLEDLGGLFFVREPLVRGFVVV